MCILEILKLIVSAVIPIVVVVFGWKINRQIKKVEYSNWANQKVVEKKLNLFDEIAPKLNDMYCFYLFIGNWKELSPSDIIGIKRQLDKKVYIYKSILGQDFFETYLSFMAEAFTVYTGAGEDAKINADGMECRSVHSSKPWNTAWDTCFREDMFNEEKFICSYEKLMTAFAKTIGIRF